MSLTVEPVWVANGSDEEGMLVFTDQRRLVAVLTRLSHEDEEDAGHWYLEAGFGRLDGPNHPTFPDLEAALDWLTQRLNMRGIQPPPVGLVVC